MSGKSLRLRDVFATLALGRLLLLEVYASGESSKRALGSDDSEELGAPIDIMAGMCGVEPAPEDDSDRAGDVIVGAPNLAVIRWEF